MTAPLRARQPAPRRGYALLFVVILMVALGVVVGGLLAALAQSVASSKASHEDLQQMYGCDGAIRLALEEAKKHSGDVDNTRLNRVLNKITVQLTSDLNPRTRRPFADISSIRAEASTMEVLRMGTLPFMGMRYTEEANRIVVAARTVDDAADAGERAAFAGRGRSCKTDAPNRRRTMSYFQFAQASTDVLTSPTTVQGTAATRGDLFVLTHGAPGGRRQTTDRGTTTVQHINLSGSDVFRPTPPSGQPWRFVNKKKRLGGLLGKKRKKKARRPTLEALLKFPTDAGGIPDPVMSRFVKGSDIRIIDGDWYFEDGSDFNSTPIRWSDRLPAESPAPYAYSAYDVDGTSGLSRGGGVIHYGMVDLQPGAGGDLVTQPLVTGYCYSDLVGTIDTTTLVPVGRNLITGELEPQCPLPLVREVPLLHPPIAGDLVRDAAKLGFTDPNGDTPILPMFVDVARLRASLVTAGAVAGDLGGARCIGADIATCPTGKRFKGSIWIGTRPGGPQPTGTPTTPCALDNTVPCVEANALVLYNMEELSPFRAGDDGKALSIASNLPVYVVGEVNTQAPGRRDVRNALLAPQITVLSRDFDFAKRAWGAEEDVAPVTQDLSWNISLFTSWGPNETALRDPAVHVLRQLESGISVDVVGSLVAMMTREQYLQRTVFNASKGSYSSTSDAAVAGLPVFSMSGDPDELARVTAPGSSVQFPGNGVTLEDLRYTEIEKQPPNAPRLSVDLQPLDKR